MERVIRAFAGVDVHKESIALAAVPARCRYMSAPSTSPWGGRSNRASGNSRRRDSHARHVGVPNTIHLPMLSRETVGLLASLCLGASARDVITAESTER